MRIVEGEILLFQETGWDGAIVNPPFVNALELSLPRFSGQSVMLRSAATTHIALG
jgi:hypothetical protein